MDLGEDVLCSREKRGPGVGGDDTPGESVKEGCADGVLEFFDLLAEGGLAEAYAGRGRADRAGLGGGDEGTELVEVEEGMFQYRNNACASDARKSSSGSRIMTRSAPATAVATSATFKPWASALATVAEPLRRPTVTSTPESFRLHA